MQNELPEVPPPIQPSGQPVKSGYEFITNTTGAPKKSLLPSGKSKQGRILIFAGIVLAVITIAVVIFAVMSGITNSQREEWLILAQKQAELIRITDIGTQKAQVRSTKNLAANTKATLLSSQKAVNSLAGKNGAIVNSKTLAAGKDPKTDAALKAAEQSNQFDDAFAKILKTELGEYQAQVKKLYDSTNSRSAKTTLQGVYANAGLLVEQSKQ